jgi:hypothetical protein
MTLSGEWEQSSMKLTADTRLYRADGILDAMIGREDIAMLSVSNSRYYGAKGAGAIIWQMLAEPCSATEICERLMQEFAVDAQQCRTDTLAFLQSLFDEGIVRVADDPA